jgi:hypothetical protein
MGIKKGYLGVLEPHPGGGRVAWKDVRSSGVFGDVHGEWGAVEDVAGAGETFGGSGAGNDGQERFGLADFFGVTGLEDSGTEQCEPPVFEVEALREAGGDDGDAGSLGGWL